MEGKLERVKLLKIVIAYLLSAIITFIFLISRSGGSNNRYLIVYVAIILFIVAIFIHRIRKQTFKKYQREMIGLTLTVVIVSFLNMIPIYLRVVSTMLIVILYVYGNLTKKRYND